MLVYPLPVRFQRRVLQANTLFHFPVSERIGQHLVIRRGVVAPGQVQ